MNAFLLLSQMLMLFSMMVAGFIAFKVKVFDSVGQHQVSKIVVNVLNPCLMISAIAGDKPADIASLTLQNFIAALAFYLFLIASSYLYFFIRKRAGKKDAAELKLEQLMLFLSNIGFFGIPVVKALFGDGYVICLIFYMLLFNIVAYSLGIFLAMSEGEGGAGFSPKQIINTGTVISIIAIALYLADIPVPDTVASFFSYMGNACIPLSMLLIGGSLAQLDLREIFSDGNIYLYVLLRNILVPGIGILLLRNLPFDPVIVKVCCLALSMPIGALSGMLAEQYAHRGNYCNKMIAMSTVLSVVTVPLLSLLYL
ncbi:MAG: AEC family transporter [Lachnospiraceae bacterium]|nr:AEC family transporter [Lachnospiraceae bacterium]